MQDGHNRIDTPQYIANSRDERRWRDFAKKTDEEKAEALLSVLEYNSSPSSRFYINKRRPGCTSISMSLIAVIAHLSIQWANRWLNKNGVYFNDEIGWYLDKQVLEHQLSPYHNRLAKIFEVV